MSTLRELKGRIGSVASSEKITGAMKMISSAKMHKAELALGKIVPFKSQLQTIMSNLIATDAEYTSVLTEIRTINTVAIVVLGSDDGLCGAYNINIFKDLLNHIRSLKKHFSANVIIYPVGKKIAKAVGKLNIDGVSVVAAGVSPKADLTEVKRLTELLRDDFVASKIDKVEIFGMEYISAGKQKLKVSQLLPVASEAFGTVGESNKPYLFEPDANTIYNSILPLYINSLMQESFLQNVASEQAARVMAMQSANDNAGKLLDELKLEFNKLRQQGITTELLDILGGQVEK
jgi:F-type H+-transporting ATPase subunit gamma